MSYSIRINFKRWSNISCWQPVVGCECDDIIMAVTVDVSNTSMRILRISSLWTLWGQAIKAYSYESFRSWSLRNLLGLLPSCSPSVDNRLPIAGGSLSPLLSGWFLQFFYLFINSTIFVTSNPSPKSEFLCRSDLMNSTDGLKNAFLLPLFSVLLSV